MKLWKWSLIFSLSCATLFATFSTNAEFQDVDPDYPYIEAINYNSEQGIIRGYRNGRFFRPNNSVNRAEFIAIVMRSRFTEEEAAECIEWYHDKNYWYVSFSDVPTDSWYGPYICLAQRRGIVNGHPDGTFHPGDRVTFAEAAKIIIRSGDVPVRSGLPWYEPYVRLLEQNNAIPPTVDTFSSVLKRGEMAEILYRLQEEIIDKESKTYADLASFEIHPCDNCMVIEKLNIMVPIVFGAGLDALVQEDWRQFEREMMRALQDGIVHYSGTALPGDPGNVVVTGHSSFYRNDPGKYKDVFAKLGDLEVGDVYKIYYRGTKYFYRIFEEKIVWPDEVSILDQPIGHQIGTLVTCYPVNTNWKRKVFVADRIE